MRRRPIPSAPPEGNIVPQSGKILAVDDNPVNLAVLRSVFAEYDLQTAESGSDALDIAARFRPDLVLLDIVMPEPDGYETCRRIRADAASQHAKIILVSAKASLDERLAGYRAGADDYVTKPFAVDELSAKVRVYLKLKSVEEIEAVKDRMIEVLQHSSRAPLNNIISYAEMLADEGFADEAVRAEALKIILRHARRLHRLLDKGGLLAGMKSGKHVFEFTPGDLSAVVRRALEELAPQVMEKSIAVHGTIPRRCESTFDERAVLFVVRALLENAVGFSRPGGAVEVDLKPDDDDAVLTVVDHGEGIAAHLLPRVFEPFGNPEASLYNRGDGLSLAIAQQIAAAHHAQLHASGDEAHGAAFTFALPLREPPPHDAPCAGGAV
jgi:signal transduction histidine kinase